MKLPIQSTLIAAIIAVVLFFQCQGNAQVCEKLTPNDTTRKGYFERVILNEKKILKTIDGRAVLGSGGQPLQGVFVEIFAFDAKTNEEKRVDGCRTDSSGKFSFLGIPKGKYTVRLSKDGGYEITDILIRVDPKKGVSKEIVGIVELGK